MDTTWLFVEDDAIQIAVQDQITFTFPTQEMLRHRNLPGAQPKWIRLGQFLMYLLETDEQKVDVCISPHFGIGLDFLFLIPLPACLAIAGKFTRPHFWRPHTMGVQTGGFQ